MQCNNNERDLLYILNQQQSLFSAPPILYQIQLKTMTSKNCQPQINSSIASLLPSLVITHDSIPNSFTDLYMATMLHSSNNIQHMKLLCIIPCTTHALVTISQNTSLLFIVDLNNNGQLLYSFKYVLFYS
jgi:hypothetical protein